MDLNDRRIIRDGKIRLKVKKRRKTLSDLPFKDVENNVKIGQISKPCKRQNPFVSTKSVQAKLKLEKTNEMNRLFQTLDNRTINLKDLKIEKDFYREEHSDEKPYIATQIPTSNSPDSLSVISGYQLPLDFSLKTKIRIFTDCPTTWCSSLKNTQEAEGLAIFSRNIQLDSSDAHVRSKLHSCLLNWTYPNIPWIPTFPDLSSKLDQDSKLISNNQLPFLLKSWCQSFKSIFNLTRAGFCPYFYMYSFNSSFLFLNPTIRGNATAIIITPTTKGFRNLLQAEGVSFEMPYLQGDLDEKENELNIDDDNPGCENSPGQSDEFLESIGLNKDLFPSIEARAKSGERQRLRAVDQRQQSTIVIANTHSLVAFNFLLNSDVLIAGSGKHYGIPPTMYAPMAFEGASLRQSKISVKRIKQKNQNAIETTNCIEISGMIFPLQVYRIYNIFEQQSDSFSMQMVPFQSNVSFNLSNEDVTQGKQKVECSSNKNRITKLGITTEEEEYLSQKQQIGLMANQLKYNGENVQYHLTNK